VTGPAGGLLERTLPSAAPPNGAPAAKRVVVLSALPAVRAGLRALIEAGGHYLVAADGPRRAALGDAVDAVDVLLLDAEPGTDVDDVIQAAAGAPAVVVLGAVDADERLAAALSRPVAYLPRDAAREPLLAALDAVTQGLLVLDPVAAERLLVPPGAQPARTGMAEATDTLTVREREVLQLVAEGLPNKSIARRLGISDHTVKFHVAALMAKLNAASRTEAVHQAARRGLISL
jgi:DNA-binding NarL/FixJ family response regulator